MATVVAVMAAALPALVKFVVASPLRAVLAPIYHQSVDWSQRQLFFIGTVYIALIALHRRRRITALAFFLAGTAWLSFHQAVFNYIQSLGADSFSEAHDFDLREAIFWLQTLSEIIRPQFDPRAFGLGLAVAVASFHLLRKVARQRHAQAHAGRSFRLEGLLAGAAISLSVGQTLAVTLAFYLHNSDVFFSLKKNFDNPMPVLAAGDASPQVLVYIGEATTVMDMGLYGYPRNTTPGLQRLAQESDNLLVFRNVFSTHTHTSFSLLEALSFAVDGRENLLPINDRKRLSIADVLAENGIKTSLISNQGQSGTWNHAASIVFRRAERTFSGNNARAGNSELEIRRPWDHEFFAQQLHPGPDGLHLPARLTFLHSYAGHGEYFFNIPASFRTPVDDRYQRLAAQTLLGDAGGSPEEVDKYDAAVRYIDSSLTQTIGMVQRSSRPIVFLYFSDHGESVFTGRGHEASRFTHEMARIPFLMYFNDAARRQHRDLFSKYQALSRQGHDATLAQLSSTLLDLLRLQVEARPGRDVVLTSVIGERTTLSPVVIRKTVEGIEYLNIEPTEQQPQDDLGHKLVDNSDGVSRIYVATRHKPKGGAQTCYEHAETLGAALRSRLVADCMELDLPAGGTPGEEAPLPAAILEVAAQNRMSLWLRAPAPDHRCEALAQALHRNRPRLGTVVVEFDAPVQALPEGLRQCVGLLAREGVATSYRVPADLAERCTQALQSGQPFGRADSCWQLGKALQQAHDSGLFSDIGFPYASVKAIESAEPARQFFWNAAGMRPQDYLGAVPRRFRLVGLQADDPNRPALARRPGAEAASSRL